MWWPIVKRHYDRSTKKDCSWFVVIEKHVVLTEVRGFGDPHIDKTRCLQIIKKLLYLLNQGEIFTKSEAAAILSSAVNLYRFEDVHLRRMLHLIARDFCPIADEVPLVTSSLLKDVNTSNVAYRANALRLLYHITNDTSLSQVVKFLDEAFYDDQNPVLQIASLVCAINLVKIDPRMGITLNTVYRSILYSYKEHDNFHFIHLQLVIGQERRRECIGRNAWRASSSPLESCIVARSIWQVARAEPVDPDCIDNKYNYIRSCILDKDEMVAIEGFRALERVVGISMTELNLAIVVMRRILRSRKPVLRFSAFKALQKVGLVHKVVWLTREDHVPICLDMNVYKLYMEGVNHRDNEPQAEQVSQVIKSQSLAIKEASKLINATLGVGS